MDGIDNGALMELDRKLARACQMDRGVVLTAAEVNAFVAVGGLKIISDAAQAGLIALARRRSGPIAPDQAATASAGRVDREAVPTAMQVMKPSRPKLNEIEHRAAERQAIEAAAAIRRKRRGQPVPVAHPAS